MNVMEYMNTHIATLTPDSTLQDAVDKMDLYQFTALPVIDEESVLVGIVTEHDVAEIILRGKGQGTKRRENGKTGGRKEKTLNTEHRTADSEHDLPISPTQISVREFMTAPAVSVEDDQDIVEAARIMTEQNLTRLPVTSEGRLVGLLSRIDVCQALLNEVVE